MSDEVLFKRVPIVWVPKLEDDTEKPIQGITWGTFSNIDAFCRRLAVSIAADAEADEPFIISED